MWERDGSYRFSEINEAYFDRAEEMLSVMKEYDMIPFLHLFWVNYIPDTWAAKVSPGTVIPFEKVRPLAAYMVERFAKYMAQSILYPGIRGMRQSRWSGTIWRFLTYCMKRIPRD